MSEQPNYDPSEPRWFVPSEDPVEDVRDIYPRDRSGKVTRLHSARLVASRVWDDLVMLVSKIPTRWQVARDGDDWMTGWTQLGYISSEDIDGEEVT